MCPDDPDAVTFCPNSASNSHVVSHKAKWAPNPTRVLGRRYWWILDTKRYPCRKCGCVLRATNADSVKHAPPNLKVPFGVLIGKKISIDAHLARFINDLFPTTPSDQLDRIINHWHHEHIHEAMVKYASLRVRRAHKRDLAARGNMDTFVVRISAAEAARRHAEAAEKSKAAAEAAKVASRPRETPLRSLSGFRDKKVTSLRAHGIRTVEDLARSHPQFWGEHQVLSVSGTPTSRNELVASLHSRPRHVVPRRGRSHLEILLPTRSRVSHWAPREPRLTRCPGYGGSSVDIRLTPSSSLSLAHLSPTVASALSTMMLRSSLPRPCLALSRGARAFLARRGSFAAATARRFAIKRRGRSKTGSLVS